MQQYMYITATAALYTASMYTLMKTTPGLLHILECLHRVRSWCPYLGVVTEVFPKGAGYALCVPLSVDGAGHDGSIGPVHLMEPQTEQVIH